MIVVQSLGHHCCSIIIRCSYNDDEVYMTGNDDTMCEEEAGNICINTDQIHKR
jgi:hypothetical protein